MNINKVLLPYRPTVDRNSALTVLEDFVGHLLEIGFANQTKKFTEEETEQLATEGIYSLGVGRGETYEELGFKSETSLIVDMLGITKDAALEKLCEIMDRHNHDGHLRKQRYSITWIIRQAYRLGYDPVLVVRITQEVVRAFLTALQAEKREFVETPETRLILNTTGRQFGPFSVSRFVRDLTVSGRPITPVSWFIQVHDEAKERQAAAAKRAETEKFEGFLIPTRYGPRHGVWIDDGDPYLSEKLAIQKDAVIVRNGKGNVVILSRTMHLDIVGEQLADDEYDEAEYPIWKYDSRFNAVFNGTEGVESPPTKKTKEEIIGIVQAYAMLKN